MTVLSAWDSEWIMQNKRHCNHHIQMCDSRAYMGHPQKKAPGMLRGLSEQIQFQMLD